MSVAPLTESLRAAGERAADDLQIDEPHRDDAIRVFALSEFAAATARRQRDWLRSALAAGTFDGPPDPSRLAGDVDAELEGVADLDGLKRALRVVRQRYQLLIVWRHCLAQASLEETTASCSTMADLLIDMALDCLSGWLQQKRGVPIGAESGEPQRMVVLALGKLGASELNLSSDVDLVFCYPEHGQTDRGETNQQFFVRLGQELIQALDLVTADGFVFRVDMRLRPYGASGPLALDFTGLEDYYATQGRDWERYALMKARPCAGNLAAGRSLLDDLAPFVFRRYLDFGAIDSLRDMKARLVADRQHPDDVKLGPGGIREVEFCVQMQQMVWGGREAELRSPRLLEVLPALRALGHLEPSEVQSLTDSYRFLRDTEHSLQAVADRQTQRLPGSEAEQLRLAIARGFEDYPSFLERLDAHRAAVADIFEAQLGGPDPAGEAEPARLPLWRQPDDFERLAAAGFSDPATASAALVSLVTARDRPQVSADARGRLDKLMPLLLEDVLRSSDPDLALERSLPVIRAVLRRSAYLALLTENPDCRQHFVSLVSTSLWLARTLADYPAFFDALLDQQALTLVPDRDALREALAADLARVDGDFERALEVLREFKSHHVFNVALAEVRGTLPLMRVSDALTFLAEAVLAEALDLAWEDNLGRFPEYASPRPFIIVGYGKLGGIELGPGSDLDIVFVHDLPASASPFLHRLVRRLLHVLTAPTYNGTLYEIDTRLRPSGNAGTMVSSLDAFRSYQQSRAWVWEHQALVRARVVAGDPELADRFETVRREVLCQPRDKKELAEEIRNMRARIVEHAGSSADEDLKRGTGGIVDIEFVVQYLVLAHAHAHPSLTEFTDNVRILDAVERAGLLPGSAVARLREAYLGLRAEWHRAVLDIPDRERAVETLARYRSDVEQIGAQVFAS